MRSIRIWNNVLNQDEISNLNLTVTNNVELPNEILDLDFNDLPNILTKGSFIGSNYEYVLDQ